MAVYSLGKKNASWYLLASREKKEGTCRCRRRKKKGWKGVYLQFRKRNRATIKVEVPGEPTRRREKEGSLPW